MITLFITTYEIFDEQYDLDVFANFGNDYDMKFTISSFEMSGEDEVTEDDRDRLLNALSYGLALHSGIEKGSIINQIITTFSKDLTIDELNILLHSLTYPYENVDKFEIENHNSKGYLDYIKLFAIDDSSVSIETKASGGAMFYDVIYNDYYEFKE